MGGPHGQKSAWVTAHTVPAPMPPQEAPDRGGVGSNWRFSTNISLYHKNRARWWHSYYGTLLFGSKC